MGSKNNSILFTGKEKKQNKDTPMAVHIYLLKQVPKAQWAHEAIAINIS